jgi:hypothetical protein
VPCDDKADCSGGQFCCGTTGPSGRYTSIQCQSQPCDPNQGQYEFCDPNAQTDECAASNMSCQASQELPGYYRCAP